MKKFLYIFERKNKMYIKLLMMITFVIILVILLTSSLLYKNYETFGLSMINSYENDKLAQTSYSATYMKESASRLVMQLYVDRDIQKLLYNTPINMLEVKDCVDKLISYKATESFIHSVYIYNGKSDTFLTTLSTEGVKDRKDFYDNEMIKLLDHYNDYNILYPIPRKIPMPFIPMDDKHYSNVYTFIYFKNLKANQSLESAIIVNVKEEWLRNMINTMEINTDGEIFIIDNEGKVVTGNHTYSMKDNISEKEYIKKILKSQQDTGYFIEEVEGNKSVINYNTSNLLRWKFISITPYKNIKYKISKMKYVTLFVCILILILGIGSSIFMSHRLWKPIKNILNRMKKLEKDKRESYYVLKNRKLKAILENENSLDIENLENMFNEFRIQVKREAPIAMILFKIDNFARIKDRYNYKDIEVFKFSIMNIAAEMCTKKFNHECIDMDEDHVVLIINVDDNQKQIWIDKIKQIILDVQLAMEQYFELSISATISSITDKLSNICYTYIETLKYSQYRFYYGHKSIIQANEFKELEQKEYEYPIQTEHQIIDALMLGKIEEAKNYYQEIINQALSYSYDSMYQVILRISLAISTVFKKMEKNYNCIFPFNFNSYFMEIGKLETIEEVNNKFLGLFEEISKKLEKNKNLKHDQLINTVIEIIKVNYKDVNLSINTIADQHNITANYLNRIFKKHTSVSVSQYINQTRIENIKNLLETTSKPINEIAEECGFVNTSYFYTLFKKSYGITANEYRMKLKKI